MINDVHITPLKIIPDERGEIFHMLRNDSPIFNEFGEVYFSTCYPGVVKGWHEHTKQTQNYCVIVGMIKLVLFDNRKDSSTFGNLIELFIGEKNYSLVTIPPGVINGYKNISTTKVYLANCSDIPHERNEMIRYDPTDQNFIDYNWSIKFR